MIKQDTAMLTATNSSSLGTAQRQIVNHIQTIVRNRKPTPSNMNNPYFNPESVQD